MHAGPPKLVPDELLEQQRNTLASPRRRHRLVPQAIAFMYYQLSVLLYIVRPKWSYRLNADFEDHAEHEYAHFVEDNEWLSQRPYDGVFADDYGRFASLADLFRQIGHDERIHKIESVQRMDQPRFS